MRQRPLDEYEIQPRNSARSIGLMATAVLLIGGCTPAMILGWTRRSDVDDAAA